MTFHLTFVLLAGTLDIATQVAVEVVVGKTLKDKSNQQFKNKNIQNKTRVKLFRFVWMIVAFPPQRLVNIYR